MENKEETVVVEDFEEVEDIITPSIISTTIG